MKNSKQRLEDIERKLERYKKEIDDAKRVCSFFVQIQ